MAEAPKSSKAKPKPKADAVEDAVVIAETPADPKTEVVAEVTPPESEAEPVSPKPEKIKTKTPSAPETPKPSEPHRAGRSAVGGAVGLITGGIIAAVIGFGAARYVVPEGWPFPGVAPAEDPVVMAVEAQGIELAQLGQALAGLEGRVSAQESDTGLADAQAAIRARIDTLQTSLSDSGSRIDALSGRLDVLEKMAPEGSAAAQTAAEAYARELANLREMFAGELDKVEAAQADAAALEASAAEAAKAAAGRAALARVTAALDTGRPFDLPLADLAAATGVAVPAALAEAATTGVPTLSALQEAFPPVAREALDAAIRAAVADGSMNRYTAFLRTQLGTRSLEPQQGDDADAVLSRAEDALRQGRIAEALTELEALPEAAQAPLAAWRTQAQQRLDALTAGSALAEQMK